MRYSMWILAFAMSFAAHAASFDCAKPNGVIDSILCGDDELSRLDEQLEKTYEATLASHGDSRGIEESQRTWIERRDRCGRYENPAGVRACLQNAYRERIVGVSALSTPKGDVFGLYTRKVPNCFVSESATRPHACYEDVEDRITIADVTDAIYVRMELNFFNGHTCEFEGKATWRNGRLAVQGNEADVDCRFDMYSNGKEILSVVQDEMQVACHYYCGVRGTLHGA